MFSDWSHAVGPYSLSPLSPCLLLRRGTHELLQSNFGCIFFGVVDVLAIVPEACVDYLVAFNRDRGGPGSASASTIRYNVEDWRVLLGTATVVFSRCQLDFLCTPLRQVCPEKCISWQIIYTGRKKTRSFRVGIQTLKLILPSRGS